jgi:Flp pilus assembly protein TadD
VHNLLGVAFASAGRYDDAERELRRSISLASRIAEPHYWLGEVLLAKKNLAGARAEFSEAIRLQPNDQRARDRLRQLESR